MSAQVQELTEKEVEEMVANRLLSEWIHKQDALELLLRIRNAYVVLLNQARLERNAARRVAYNLEQELATCKAQIIVGEL